MTVILSWDKDIYTVFTISVKFDIKSLLFDIEQKYM